MRNKCLLCELPHLCCLLQQPELTKTGPQWPPLVNAFPLCLQRLNHKRYETHISDCVCHTLAKRFRTRCFLLRKREAGDADSRRALLSVPEPREKGKTDLTADGPPQLCAYSRAGVLLCFSVHGGMLSLSLSLCLFTCVSQSASLSLSSLFLCVSVPTSLPQRRRRRGSGGRGGLRL